MYNKQFKSIPVRGYSLTVTSLLFATKPIFKTLGILNRVTNIYQLANTRPLSSQDSVKVDVPLKRQKNKKRITTGVPHFQEALINNKVPITFYIILKSLLNDDNTSTVIDKSIKQVIKFHDDMIRNHGIVEGTARYNGIRLYCIRLLEGQNPDNPGWVATSRKYKWPSGLCELLPLYKQVLDSKCTESDRIIRSILYLNRLCEGNGVIDVSTITRQVALDPEFVNQFQSYLDTNNFKLEEDLSVLKAKPSVRVVSNGPNSKPKWQTAELEAYYLMKSSFNIHFLQLCKATENMDLYEYMEARASLINRVDRKRLRYITAIRDKGNKSRAVAISDYWTQVLLEPIMLDIQKFTRKRWKGVSYAHSHAKGFNSFKNRIKPGFKSYDLTAWTDGLPSTLQRMLLEARYGHEIANAWYSLVVDCEWDVKGSKTRIKYGTGQGMGTAGSFDIATLTDLELLNMTYTKHYGVAISKHNTTKVGDDLVIFDPDNHVYKYYTEDIKMEINKSKTKEATDGNICGEFVSRNINNGKEVSRLSANICRAVKKNILDLPQLTQHLSERGINILLPLTHIFDSMKIKGNHRLLVIRTLYLLCLTNTGPELELLRKSLKEHFFNEIAADNILSLYATSKEGIEQFRKLFLVYQVGVTYKSIIDKLDDVMKGIDGAEFDSSRQLNEESELGKIWARKGDSIEFLTSILILSRSFRAINDMYRAEDFRYVEDVYLTLAKTEQSVSFKELGVISTTDMVWRPKATKLFNFCKSLDLVSLDGLEFIRYDEDRTKPNFYYNTLVTTKLLMPYSDPIFKGVEDVPVIGTQSDNKTGHNRER